MSECKYCGGSGLIMSGGEAKQCRCILEKLSNKRYIQSGLTPVMEEYTFDKFNFKYYPTDKVDEVKGVTYAQTAQLTYKAALAFVKKFNKDTLQEGLLFTGPVGSGKTFLSCCIANALVQKGQKVLFMVVPDWLDQIRATYDGQNGEITEQTLLDKAKEIPLLILDDLGVHNYTDWTKNKIYSLINYRINYQLPTIVTTNLSVQQLSLHLGERTASRLFQMCRIYRLLVENNIRYVKRIENK